MQDRLKQWQALTPEEQEHHREKREWFTSLSAEEQLEVKDNIKKFRKLPDEERKKLRTYWYHESPENQKETK